jgi:hypothetical protein
MDRIAILYGESHGNVSSLVNRGSETLIVVHHEAMTLSAHEDSISRIFDVFSTNRF